jgi:hypothetical protein
MGRHGGRPRKQGDREPNGRLRRVACVNDRGHEALLAHRTAILGGADPHNPLAGECLGILYLRGDLADPGLDSVEAAEQGHQRYLAGIRYGRDHAAVWSGSGQPNPNPRSVLGSFLPDDRGPLAGFDSDEESDTDYRRRRARRLRRATARLLVFGPYPIFVLDDIVVYLHRMRFMDEDRQPPYVLEAERATIAALRVALGALVIEYR